MQQQPSKQSLAPPNGVAPFPPLPFGHLNKNPPAAEQNLLQHHLNLQYHHQQQQYQHFLQQNSNLINQSKQQKPRAPSPQQQHKANYHPNQQHFTPPQQHQHPGLYPPPPHFTHRAPEPHVSSKAGGLPSVPYLPLPPSGIKTPLENSNHHGNHANLKPPASQIPSTPPFSKHYQHPSQPHHLPAQQSNAATAAANSLHQTAAGAPQTKRNPTDMFGASQQQQQQPKSASRNQHPNMLNPLAGFLNEFGGAPGSSAGPFPGSHSLPPGLSPYNIPGFDPALLGNPPFLSIRSLLIQTALTRSRSSFRLKRTVQTRVRFQVLASSSK